MPRTWIRTLAFVVGLLAVATACESGRSGVVVTANSNFDQYTRSPSEAQWQWMRDHYERMVVWSPYWDNRLEHFDDVLVYLNAYAIPVGDDLATQHPDWIMREADGTPTYLHFACHQAGGCPQYAGDLGNPEFVAHQMARIASLVERGYPGLMLDDVNMVHRWAAVDGTKVTPIDPRTGSAITVDDWRTSMADFVTLVRTTFPDLEIMHNVVWFADAPTHDHPEVDRQIAAADFLMLERGATDRGLTSGTGRWSLQALLGYVDRAHALGTGVLLMDEGGTDAHQTYNLAAALLVNTGFDLVGSERASATSPTSYWEGFLTDLGDATRPRWNRQGFILRDFEEGFVVLREPGLGPDTYTLYEPMIDLDGNLVSEVTLAGGQAEILRKP